MSDSQYFNRSYKKWVHWKTIVWLKSKIAILILIIPLCKTSDLIIIIRWLVLTLIKLSTLSAWQELLAFTVAQREPLEEGKNLASRISHKTKFSQVNWSRVLLSLVNSKEPGWAFPEKTISTFDLVVQSKPTTNPLLCDLYPSSRAKVWIYARSNDVKDEGNSSSENKNHQNIFWKEINFITL
jgi:hypothetical protein